MSNGSSLGSRVSQGYIDFGSYWGKSIRAKQLDLVEGVLNFGSNSLSGDTGIELEGHLTDFVSSMAHDGLLGSVIFISAGWDSACALYREGCIPSIQLLEKYDIPDAVSYVMLDDKEFHQLSWLIKSLARTIATVEGKGTSLRVSYIGDELEIVSKTRSYVFKERGDFDHDVRLAKRGVVVPRVITFKDDFAETWERQHGREVATYDYEGSLGDDAQ